MANVNKRVPGAQEYYSLNEPSVGTPFSAETFPHNKDLPPLFQPLEIRGVKFPNRVFVSPMCQYSSDNGHATDWHLVHIGGFATRGAGAITMEATAVVPEGRISPEDAGLWTDSQIPPLKRIVDFAHSQGSIIGIQLAHAGRKASTYAPWVVSDAARTRKLSKWEALEDEGGWPDKVFAPSAVPHNDTYPKPKEMGEEDLKYVEEAFLSSVKRAEQAGFDFIALHGGHGYLLHEFVSPLSNIRNDDYGGPSLENRMRYPLRITRRVRELWKDKPLFYRISATDWAEGPEQGEDGVWKQWGVEQSKIFVGELKKLGVDLVDVSTGGVWDQQKITIGPNYQVPFAEEIKKAHPDIVVGTVGLIETATQANNILKEGKADIVSLARAMIKNPHWVMQAAEDLGVSVKPANQYERGWMKMLQTHRN